MVSINACVKSISTNMAGNTESDVRQGLSVFSHTHTYFGSFHRIVCCLYIYDALFYTRMS